MTQQITPENEFQQMERYDEAQVVQEIEGHVVLKQYFYELKNGAIGISWIGIKALSSYMSKNGMPISIVHVEREETEDAFRYTATARLLTTGEERIGVSEQPKIMKTSAGEVKDPFALQKALSKAQRNALRIFLPESAIEAAYQRWKSGGAVDPKNVTAPSSPERQPATLTEAPCSCGHAKTPDHYSDGKEVICVTCIKAKNESTHSLKPWR